MHGPATLHSESNPRSERDLVRALPRGANRACVLLARAGFYQRERRFTEFGRTAREGLELAQQQDRTELQAFFHHLIGQVHAPTNRDRSGGTRALRGSLHVSSGRVWTIGNLKNEHAALAVVGALTDTRQFGAAQERINKFQNRRRRGILGAEEPRRNCCVRTSANIRLRTWGIPTGGSRDAG